MLHTFSTRYSLDGKAANRNFTTTLLFHTADVIDDRRGYDLGLEYVTLIRPILIKRVGIYSTTLSTLPAPGKRKIDRRDHITRYYDDLGTGGGPVTDDPAILSVCAEFFKYTFRGPAGSILIRGTLTEVMLRSDDAGNPIEEGASPYTRFVTFADGLLSLFNGLGGKGLVMPGPKKDDKGEWIPQGSYENSAREIQKIKFDGFIERDLTNTQRSLDAKSLNLIRGRIRYMESIYNDALAAADGDKNAIPAEIRADLTELGKEVFSKHSAQERQKAKAPLTIKSYIKA